MTNDCTRARSLDDMRDAIDLVHQYTLHFPELPQPYITFPRTISRTFPALTLQVKIDDFEPWREALNMDPHKISLRPVAREGFLETTQEVTVELPDRTVTVMVLLYAPGLPHSTELSKQEQVSNA